MTQRTEVHGISPEALQQMMRQALEEATTPLRREVEALREQLRLQRRVITHKEAPAFFAEEVTPETVRDLYIKKQGLPATRRGRLYFIKLEDLFDWQTQAQKRPGNRRPSTADQTPTGSAP